MAGSTTTYSKTTRGLRALVKKLPKDAGLVLSVLDESLTAEALASKLPDLDDRSLEFAVSWLLGGGFIKSVVNNPFPDSGWGETKNSGAIEVNEIGINEFTVSEKPAVEKGLNMAKSTSEEGAALEAEKQRLEQADVEVRERAETALKAQIESQAPDADEEGVAVLAEELLPGAREVTSKLQLDVEETKDAIDAALTPTSEIPDLGEKPEEAPQQIEEFWEAPTEELELGQASADVQEEVEALLAAETNPSGAVDIDDSFVQQGEKGSRKFEAAASTRREESAAEKTERKKIEKEAAKEKARLEAAIKDERRRENKVNDSGTLEVALHRAKEWVIALLKSIKPLSIYALGVLFLLIIAAQFINFHIWINPIEKMIAKEIQGDINIKTVRISLFPSPHLVLEDLQAADSTTVRAEKVHIYPTFSNLKERLLNASNGPYKAKQVLIEGFSLAQKDFSQLSSWASSFSNDKQLTVNKVVFKNIAVNLNSLALPHFNGALLLDKAGLLTQGNFSSVNESLNIAISHTNNKYFVDLTAKQWRSPLAPYPAFNTLNASGNINKKSLSLSKISGVLYNGSIAGKLDVDLSSDKLPSKGELKISNLYINDMADDLKLNNHLDGKLSTNGSFSFNVNKASNSIEKLRLNAIFDIKNGSLKKVDLVEAMRTGNLAGSTRFTKLSGFATKGSGAYRFTNIRLKDSQLRASGQLSISADNRAYADVATTIAVNRNDVKTQLTIDGPMTHLKLKN